MIKTFEDIKQSCKDNKTVYRVLPFVIPETTYLGKRTNYYIIRGKIKYCDTSKLGDFKQGTFTYVMDNSEHQILPTIQMGKTLINTCYDICRTWTDKSVEVISKIRNVEPIEITLDKCYLFDTLKNAIDYTQLLITTEEKKNIKIIISPDTLNNLVEITNN